MIKEVSRPYERSDSWSKATGRALYGADVSLPNMAYLYSVQSQYAHADIVSIDTSIAEQADGVLMVITAKDIPGENRFGRMCPDEYFIAEKQVRHIGDVVACVVAETPAQAKRAAELVKVEYRPLEVLTDPRKAIGSSTIISEEFPDNVCCDYISGKGNIEKGFQNAEILLNTSYKTAHIEHAYLEPEAVIVAPGRTLKEIRVIGSVQDIYGVRAYISKAMAMPLSRVHVEVEEVGGSFGGKVEICASMGVRCAIAAVRLHRPVKCVNTREMSIMQSHKRHPIDFDIKLGANKDGRMTTAHVEAYLDSGGYVNESPIVTWKSITCGLGPYKFEHVKYHSRAVMTNNPVTGAMRGFGTPQCIFAIENAINEMAQKLGMSPLELRRINLIHDGDSQQTGQVMDFHPVSISSVMEKAASAIEFEEKYKKYASSQQTGRYRYGVGLACSMRGVSFGARGNDVGRAEIKVSEDGEVFVSCGLVEMGQGSRTVLGQIAADALGVPYSSITMDTVNTDSCPETGAAGASRGTFIGGHAIIEASIKVKKIMLSVLEESEGKAIGEVSFSNGKVIADGQEYSFCEVAALCYKKMKTPVAIGTYSVKPMSWNQEIGYGDPYCSYTYSCHAAEIELDTYTGNVRVLKVVGCHDPGTVVNPMTASGQVEGGIVMGLGMALYEDLGMKANGEISHCNFDNYILPTSMDICDIEVIFDSHDDPAGPFGARSLGEPATEPTVAAVIGAINQAVGIAGFIKELPVSSEKIYNQLQKLGI